MKKALFPTIFTLLLTGLIACSKDNALMGSGQWQDPETGLIWMRCSVGQEWTGSGCSGQALELKWQDAKDYVPLFNEKVAFAGKRTWRLPTIAELSSIRKCSNGWARRASKTVGNSTKAGSVLTQKIPDGRGGKITVPKYCERGSSQPTIDTRIFPSTLPKFYRSSSIYAGNNGSEWGVNFSSGYGYYDYKYDPYCVRLVRAR